MKRVLSVIQTPTFGGPHNTIMRLAGPLREAGYDSIVCLPEQSESGVDRMRGAGLEVHQLPIHRMRKSLDPRPHWRFLSGFRPTIRAMMTLMEREGIDLVQVCGLMSIHGGIAADRMGLPVMWQLLGTFAPMPLRRILVPKLRQCADAVMTTGRETGRLHPGLDRIADRVLPFFPPVDLDEFAPDAARRAELRGALGLGPEDIVIGTVGNRNRTKAHEVFVEAARIASRDRADLRFRILGDMSPANAAAYEREVMAPARASGLMENGILGFVDQGVRVPDFLRAADVFLLTSRVEGAPTVLIEAMACGLPVVSTTVGSVAEIVEEGETGLLAPSGDAQGLAGGLLRLVADPALRSRLGASGRAAAERRFGISQCVARHVEAYELAARNRAGRRREQVIGG